MRQPIILAIFFLENCIKLIQEMDQEIGKRVFIYSQILGKQCNIIVMTSKCAENQFGSIHDLGILYGGIMHYHPNFSE